MSKTQQQSPQSSNAPTTCGPTVDADAQDLLGNQALCGLPPELAAQISGVQGSVLALLADLPPIGTAGQDAGASIADGDPVGLGRHGSTASTKAGAVSKGIFDGFSVLDQVAIEDAQATTDPAWAQAESDLLDVELELESAGSAVLASLSLGAAGGGDCGTDVAGSIEARVSDLEPAVQTAADMKALVAEVGAAIGPAARDAAKQIRGVLDTLEGDDRAYVEGFARKGAGSEVLAALDGGPQIDDAPPIVGGESPENEAPDEVADPTAMDEATRQAGASGPKGPGAAGTGEDVAIPREDRVGSGSSSKLERSGAGVKKTDKSWKDDRSDSTTEKTAKLGAEPAGTVSVSGQRDHAEWGPDGSGSQKTTGGGAQIDKDGKGSVNVSSKTETVDASKNPTVKSRSASLDTDGKLQVSGGAGGRDVNDTAWGVEGSGSADFKMTETNGIALEGASASAKVQFGPVRVETRTGYKDTFGVPSPQGAQWAVSWSRTFDASLGGGGGNASASVGMSGKHSRTCSGIEVFPTAEAAKAFQDRGSLPAFVPTIPDVFAPAIDDMQDGERVTVSTGTDLGVDGSASYAGVTATAGASAGTGDQIQIEKKGGKVEVTVMKLSREGAEAGASAGVGVNGSVGRGRARHTTVSFDLSTPAGRAAYEAWARNPNATPTTGPGAAKVSEGSGTSKSSKVGLNAGPADAGDLSETGVYEETLADGRKAKTHFGSRETSTEASVPVAGKLHDDKRKYGITARTIDDGKGNSQTSWTLKSEVKADTAAASSEGLARAEGDRHYKDALVDAPASGKWTVEEDLSDDDVKTFVTKVRSGTYAPKHSEELQERLALAKGDPDKERAAIAAYVAEGGHDGVRGIKECPGVEGGKRYYKLEGDTYLTGREGHKQFTAKLAALRERMADPNAPLDAIAADGRALLSEAAAKSSQLQNPANYPDLPNAARMEIISEVRGQIREVNAFLNGVDAARRHAGGISREASAVGAAYRRMGAARHLTEVKMHRAEIERRLLQGYGSQSGSSARGLWPDKAFAGADEAWSMAQRSYKTAQQAEAEALAIDPYDADGAAKSSALSAIGAASLAFEQAITGFTNAHESYRSLREKVEAAKPGVVRTDKARDLPWLPVKDPTDSR